MFPRSVHIRFRYNPLIFCLGTMLCSTLVLSNQGVEVVLLTILLIIYHIHQFSEVVNVREVLHPAGMRVVLLLLSENSSDQYALLLMSVGIVTLFPRSSKAYSLAFIVLLFGKIVVEILSWVVISTELASLDAKILTAIISFCQFGYVIIRLSVLLFPVGLRTIYSVVQLNIIVFVVSSHVFGTISLLRELILWIVNIPCSDCMITGHASDCQLILFVSLSHNFGKSDIFV